MFRVHQDEIRREDLMLDLDEIARQGARRMLAQALEAKVETYIEAAREQRDEHGRALVVRNGRARERDILCGAGAVEVRAPRVNDRRVDEHGERRRCEVRQRRVGREKRREGRRVTREVNPQLRKYGRRRSPVGLTRIHKGRESVPST